MQALVAVAAGTLAALALAVPGWAAGGSHKQTFKFYFTTYNPDQSGKQSYNVWQGAATYNGHRFHLGKPKGVALLPGADGIASASKDQLVIASGDVYLLNTHSRHFRTVHPCSSAFHVAIGPDRTIWTSDQPGTLVSVPGAFNGSRCHSLSGPDTTVSGVAFDSSGRAFYADGGIDGDGTFGSLDLRHFRTHQSPSLTKANPALSAAHGIIWDPYSKTLVLVGANQVAQFDPNTLRIVSKRTMPNDSQFDQGSSDGHGHLLVADNNGNIAFLDISRTRRVGAKGTFTASTFLLGSLDDIDTTGFSASQPPSQPPPKPVSSPPFTG